MDPKGLQSDQYINQKQTVWRPPTPSTRFVRHKQYWKRQHHQPGVYPYIGTPISNAGVFRAGFLSARQENLVLPIDFNADMIQGKDVHSTSMCTSLVVL